MTAVWAEACRKPYSMGSMWEANLVHIVSRDTVSVCLAKLVHCVRTASALRAHGVQCQHNET